MAIIEVNKLRKVYASGRFAVEAVRGVDLSVEKRLNDEGATIITVAHEQNIAKQTAAFRDGLVALDERL